MQEPNSTAPEHKVSRRHAMIRTAQTVGAGALAVIGGKFLYDGKGDAGLPKPETVKLKNYFANVDFPKSAPRISVARGDQENLDKMLRAAVSGLDPELGMKRFVRNGETVLIKPNVGFERAPQLGATTNPEVLRCLIRLVFEAGAAQVLVADNPIEQAAACFSRSKIQDAAEAEGAKVLLPADVHFRSIEVRTGNPDPTRHEALGTWPVFWKPLEAADKVIGIAPIKDHNLCYASMSMKNWYGLLGGRRNQFHQAIHNIVSDLGLMMSPTMVINDGTRIMMKNGPTGGRLDDVKDGHTIVAGVDPIAVDAWCFENLLDRDPANLTYLEYATQKFGGRPFDEVQRFGQRDWRAYQRQGLIADTQVG